MCRVLALALLIASSGCSGCGNGSKSPADPPKTSGEEKIAVPGAKGAPDEGSPQSAGIGGASDPRFHLKPDEGSLKVENAQAKAGTEATAKIELSPAAGYHISTDYSTQLLLEAPPGVTLAKTQLKAGGRSKDAGDAAPFSEQGLGFAIKATAEKAGSYEIKGVFKFGICEKESCHPKKQPITITVAAN